MYDLHDIFKYNMKMSLLQHFACIKDGKFDKMIC